MRLGVPAIALAAALLGPAAAPAGEPQALSVVLRNDGSRALRCVMVKAHFMSETLDTIAAGATLDLMLQRDPSEGTLFVTANDGRRQLIENILCGADDDWSKTRGELPLLPLRTTSETHVEIRCGVESRLVCTAKSGID